MATACVSNDMPACRLLHTVQYCLLHTFLTIPCGHEMSDNKHFIAVIWPSYWHQDIIMMLCFFKLISRNFDQKQLLIIFCDDRKLPNIVNYLNAVFMAKDLGQLK